MLYLLPALTLFFACWTETFVSAKDVDKSINNYPSTGTDNYEDCINPSGKFGSCIPLIKCSALLRILQERPWKPDDMKFLQHSTCGFDNEDPLVCCVEGKKGSSHIPTIAAAATTTELPKRDNTLSPGPAPAPAPGPAVELDVLENEILQHRNFKLLPKISACGDSMPTDRIIGGNATGLGAYPWMALLGFVDTTGEVMFGCGGTLISSRYVLTAAHCVSNSKLPEGISLKFVRLGEYDQRTDPDCQNGICAPKVQDIPIEEKIPHERYDETRINENDIAIIRLKTKAVLGMFVSPVCLPPRGEILHYDLEKSNHTIVAGWGRMAVSKTDNSDILQHVNVPVRSWEDCNGFYTKRGYRKIDNSRFCAGGERGKDSCQGDSGGPLMESIYLKSIHQVRTWQFGVVSLGPSPCGSSNPALYTRVTEFMPWILDHMKP